MADVSSNIGHGVKLSGIREVMNNIQVLDTLIKMKLARALALGIADVLAHSQPTVPVDTGELRESGLAKLYLGSRRYDVGTGNSDGSIEVTLSNITKGALSHVKTMRGEVSYFRMNGAIDVAFVTHEDLNPYGGPKPAARMPGTGPKYLHNAWSARRQTLEDTIADVLNEREIHTDIIGLQKITQKGRPSKFTTDEISLNANMIAGLNSIKMLETKLRNLSKTTGMKLKGSMPRKPKSFRSADDTVKYMNKAQESLNKMYDQLRKRK